ncbi:MAG: peptidoglycan-associated lipoprotein Pal [Gammaproteobacteria bacterium]|nr:MAG: peptidoglycan-associated lipoprotein Pal [Gammaproteobacteria bacterium]
MEETPAASNPVAAPVTSPADSGAETFSTGDETAISGSNLEAEATQPTETVPFPSSNTIYFEFDSSQINDSFSSLVEEHAAYLNAHPNAHVSIEGHADERGTREYNMGLGERRANAVFRMLSLQGVPDAQMTVVSYGEEKPVAFGHNETSWRLNRRVEIVYTRR